MLNTLSDEDLDIYLFAKEKHLKQKQIATILGKSEAHITRRMKVIEDTIEYDMLNEGERTEMQIKSEMEYRKYLRSDKTESFVDVYVYDFLLAFPQEVLLRYLFVFRGQQHLIRFCFLWVYEYFASEDKPEFKAREVLSKYSYQLFKKYMATKHAWSKQLFIAVESELQRLLKRYGIKDSKPDEKFIKTVQKSAAAKGMTVAEYRDKILFSHGKEKIIKRFEQYYKLRSKAKK